MNFPTPKHPALNAVHRRRTANIELRVADAITAFAGNMKFVYIHIVGFAVWMLLVEKSPWPTLTLVVSLEAIFLSTFILVASNRQSDMQRAKADHDYVEQELELKSNTDLTRVVHELQVAMNQGMEDLHGKIDALTGVRSELERVEASPLSAWVEAETAEVSIDVLSAQIDSLQRQLHRMDERHRIERRKPGFLE